MIHTIEALGQARDVLGCEEMAAGMMPAAGLRRMRLPAQQGWYVVVLQHLNDPLGGGQFIRVQPVGQPATVSGELSADVVEACADKFLLKKAICTQLALLSGAICTEGSVVDGATAISSAQTGATIKANKNTSMFFMFMLLVVD